jgi:hypothetical protein
MRRGATPLPPRLLALWSAPRCRSTAFLRMMAERGDFEVVHEPFSHVTDFGVARVLDREVHSEEELIETLRELARERCIFFKDTTDFHYARVLTHSDFLREATHTFIIRDPKAAIASHSRLNPRLRRDEIGFAWLHEIFEAVADATRATPLVLDADEWVAAPEQYVEAYCRRVGIQHIPEALNWTPGPLPAWERTARWHTAVSESRGIAPSIAPTDVDVAGDPVLGDYLRYHEPYYRRMRSVRLVPERLESGGV